MNDIQWCEAVLEGKTLDGIFVRFKCRYWAKDVVADEAKALP